MKTVQSKIYPMHRNQYSKKQFLLHYDDQQVLKRLYEFLQTKLKREYLRTLRWNKTENAVLIYLVSPECRPTMIECFMNEGYDNFEIVQIIKYLDSDNVRTIRPRNI